MQSYETNIKEEKYKFAFGAAEIGELQPRCPVLGGRERAGKPPESLPSLRRTQGPAVRGGGSTRKGRLSGELCRNARRLPQCVGSSNPARARPSACPPPLRALVSPSGCLSGLVPDNHRARHCHYHLLIRAELQGRQEWQAHVPVPAEEARPRPLLVAGHPLPFPSSSCRPPRLGH